MSVLNYWCESDAVLLQSPFVWYIHMGSKRLAAAITMYEMAKQVSQANGAPPDSEPVASSHCHNYQHCHLTDRIRFHIEICFG